MKQRKWILVLSLTCVATGLFIGWRLGWELALQSPAVGILLRLGLVLGALWLALPGISGVWERLPRVLFLGLIVVLGVVVVRPRLIVAAAAMLVVLGAVHFGLRWLSQNMSQSPGHRK